MHALADVKSLCLRIAKSKSGAIPIEYAFLIALIAIVASFGMLQWVKT